MSRYEGYIPYEDDDEKKYSKDNVISFYNDGEDKKPKLILIIFGIVLLLIILLIILFSCGKKGKSEISTYLKTITITNGELEPVFDKNIFEYDVTSDKDSIIIRCSAENEKTTISGCNKQILISEVCKEHTVKVMAKDSEPREYKFNLCKKSKEAPLIKEISISPQGYSNTTVKVKVTAESVAKLHAKAYSFDNGETWQESNEYSVSENKVLEIKVRTEEGNETSAIKEITNIDKTEPKVKIDGSVESGVSTTSNVELTAEVTPTHTISGYKYQWYKNNQAIKNATKDTYLATASGEYKVEVKTGSGNKVTSSVYKVNKKTTTSDKYTLTINSVTGNATSWTKNNVTLTVKATASNGLHSTAYSFDGGKTFQASNTKQFTSNQEVNIVVRDKEGNKTTYKVKITKIDKTKPVVNVAGDRYVNSTITATATPATAVSGYTYQWYKDNEIIKGATSKTYTPTAAGTYKVVVTTGTGEKVAVSNIGITNKTTPTVSLKSSVTSGTWTKSDVKLTATVKNGEATKYVWYKDNKTYSSCTASTCTISTTQDATYKVKVTVESSTITSGTINVKLDKTVPTAPTITLTPNKESASNVKAEIKSGTDSHSGVSKVQYSYDSKTWKTYSSSAYILKTTGEKTLYARTVDKAGNVSKVVKALALCDKDTVTVKKDSNGTSDSGSWFKLVYTQKYSDLTGITANKYQYAYWKATKTTDTSNTQSSLVAEKCGTAPPKDATIRTTTSGKTIALYQKYAKQYYCMAVRPYRATEFTNLNRWTVQWKYASTSGTVKASSYNGN